MGVDNDTMEKTGRGRPTKYLSVGGTDIWDMGLLDVRAAHGET